MFHDLRRLSPMLINHHVFWVAIPAAVIICFMCIAWRLVLTADPETKRILKLDHSDHAW